MGGFGPKRYSSTINTMTNTICQANGYGEYEDHNMSFGDI